MKPKFKNHSCFAPCKSGVAALIVTLAFAHSASAQTNTKTGQYSGNQVTTGRHNTSNGFAALQRTKNGSYNAAFGSQSLQYNIDGINNTATGYGSMKFNTSGSFNTATGSFSLFRNTSGKFNTATGREALFDSTTGSNNVACGYQSLRKNKTGGFNVAIGDGALWGNTSGSSNIGIGEDGGYNLTTGSNNICIGNKGVAGESGIIRLGESGTHSKTFIAGQVGVGTQTASVPLEVGGGFVSSTDGLGIASFGPSTSQHLAFDNNEIMSYNGNTPSTLYLGYWGGNVALASSGTGANVGVGTSTPSRGKLEVVGSVSNQPNPGNVSVYSSTGVIANTPAGTDSISIYATNSVFAGNFIAFSDVRTKVIKGKTDGAADLSTLLGIEVTDYAFKDVIGRGNAAQKKVIAQQVEKVYPQAVSRSTDVVPDIYQRAVVKDGWVTLDTDLKKGDRVRLIGDRNDEICKVLEVRDNGFRADYKADSDKVFVYGREVNDFRAVDYEAISMLNVSATQELARKLEASEKKLAASEKRFAELETRLIRLESGLPTAPDAPLTVSVDLPN